MRNSSFIKPLALIALVSATFSVQAHRAWILPDTTVLSGDKPVATFDIAVSNMIFNFDHSALKADALTLMNPAGKELQPENVATTKHRTVFDLTLENEGTYRIFSASSGLRAMWEDQEGKRQFYPGRGEHFELAKFKQVVPAKAKNLVITQFSRRMETFVTAGAPSTQTLAISKQGLELSPITHPNDLFAGEPAKFQFFIDGAKANGVEVTLIKEGTRYRNSPDEIKLTGDKNGVVNIQWQGAGRYYLEASYKDNNAKKPATTRAGSYSAVFEVLPD